MGLPGFESNSTAQRPWMSLCFLTRKMREGGGGVGLVIRERGGVGGNDSFLVGLLWEVVRQDMCGTERRAWHLATK